MKRAVKLLSVIVALLLLVTTIMSLQSVGASNVKVAETGADYGLADSCQEGMILHAWNASYNNIKSHLKEIADAGFTSIQTSPVQQPKDYNGSWTDVGGQWWKLYQPLSFSIATGGSWIGNKSELQSLCTEAHKYGIKIICDIVANHVGGDQSYVDGGLGYYESQLYNNQSQYFHSYFKGDDNSVESTVKGSIGMPDLNTSDSYVQSRVISLLKECIDVGVDGFRFDAAKHIETPDDGAYASDFWPNVLGAATSYGNNKNKDIYYYGEILHRPGAGRSWNSYTKYMSIVDNVTGNNRTKNVKNGNASSVASTKYNTGQSSEKIVLWAESHDTYSNGSGEYDYSGNYTQSELDRSYCFSAALSGSTVLYFVRPYGGMGDFNSSTYKASHIAAANKFHNYFIDAEQITSSSGNFAICERYFSSFNTGAVIVNCGGTSGSLANVSLKKMADGTYKEMVTGTSVTVSGGVITSGSIGSSGVAVIYNDVPVNKPLNTISQAGGNFTSDTLELTIGLLNATSGTYQIGSGSKTTYTKNTTITIGSGVSYGSTIKVTLTATDGSSSNTSTYTFKKVDPNDIPFKFPTDRTVYLVDEANWGGANCYAWADGNTNNAAWPGIGMTDAGEFEGYAVYSYDVPNNMNNVIFNNGTIQTDDLEFVQYAYYNNKSNEWVNVTPPSTVETNATTPTTATVATIATMATVETTPVPSTSSAAYYLGDTDLSQIVNARDASMMQQHLSYLVTLTNEQIYCSDIDNSGDLSVVDVTLIKQYLANVSVSYKIGCLMSMTDPTEETYSTAATTATSATIATTATQATLPTSSSNGTTVYVDMGSTCDAYAYYWSGSSGPVSWPGVKMENVSGSVYKVVVSSGNDMIIFSINGGNQTPDLSIPGNNYIYYKNSDSWGTYSGTVNPTTSTTATTSSDGTTVYVDMGSSCDAYAYYWSGSSGPVSWPGVKMENVSGSVYKVVVPSGNDMIIFSINGGNQTPDLSIPGNNYIYYKNSGSWQKYS